VANADHKQRHGERVHLLHPAPLLQEQQQAQQDLFC
jgi:hypothetical protein